MLHTITKVPEELALHETPMSQSYGIEYVCNDAWEEVDDYLTALATRALEQDYELKVVVTMGLFSTAHSEPKLQSRLSSFAEKGVLTVSHSRSPSYSYGKAPF